MQKLSHIFLIKFQVEKNLQVDPKSFFLVFRFYCSRAGEIYSALDIKLKSSTEQLNFHSVIVANLPNIIPSDECGAS